MILQLLVNNVFNFHVSIFTYTNLFWLIFLWRSICGALQGQRNKSKFDKLQFKKRRERSEANDQNSKLNLAYEEICYTYSCSRCSSCEGEKKHKWVRGCASNEYKSMICEESDKLRILPVDSTPGCGEKEKKDNFISGPFPQERLTNVEVYISESLPLNDEFSWEYRLIFHNTQELTKLS